MTWRNILCALKFLSLSLSISVIKANLRHGDTDTDILLLVFISFGFISFHIYGQQHHLSMMCVCIFCFVFIYIYVVCKYQPFQKEDRFAFKLTLNGWFLFNLLRQQWKILRQAQYRHRSTRYRMYVCICIYENCNHLFICENDKKCEFFINKMRYYAIISVD